MSIWRIILWLMASTLIWVFAHDYAADHVNNRIDSQIEKAGSGELNFKWDPKQAKHRVTIFESQFDGQYFYGKQVAVSFQMPAWPLIPENYEQLLLDIKTAPKSSFSVALETSDPDAGLFYTAKINTESGSNELNLPDLDWQVSSGGIVDWVAIPKASTWVVRLFSKHDLKWNFNRLSLLQTEAFGLNDWKHAGCGDTRQTGQWLISCASSNEIIKIDQQINQQSTTQVFKFDKFLGVTPWLILLVAFLLLILVFWGFRRAQLVALLALIFSAFLLYFPVSHFFEAQDSKWVLFLVVLVLCVVFFNLRHQWRFNQKHSLGPWMVVLVVTLMLWYQSDFQLGFLAFMPAYLLWAGLQQGLMVFVYEWVSGNDRGPIKPHVVVFFVAWCFAVVHLPNHYLMALTLVAGLFWVWVWHKHKNLMLMVVSHALWALLLYQWVGETWLYSARVGANFL